MSLNRAALFLATVAGVVALVGTPAAAKPWPDPPRQSGSPVVVQQVDVPVPVRVGDARAEAFQMGAAALLGAVLGGAVMRQRRRTRTGAVTSPTVAVDQQPPTSTPVLQ